MNVHLPSPRHTWPGRLVNLAVVVVVVALAAAAFVLSYSGVHTIVLQAGVSARLARVYPGLFDAVLVIACVAAVMLRDARWWARGYAWLVIIAVMAVVGAAGAVHAMNVTLPHRKTEGVVAAVPWVLVLLGFSLMLTMLRYSRAQHTAAVPAGWRAGRRAARQQADGGPQTAALPIEAPVAIEAPGPVEPALPIFGPVPMEAAFAAAPAEPDGRPAPALPPAAPGEQTAGAGRPEPPEPAEPPSDGVHAPTVVVPALAAREAPPAGPAVQQRTRPDHVIAAGEAADADQPPPAGAPAPPDQPTQAARPTSAEEPVPADAVPARGDAAEAEEPVPAKAVPPRGETAEAEEPVPAAVPARGETAEAESATTAIEQAPAEQPVPTNEQAPAEQPVPTNEPMPTGELATAAAGPSAPEPVTDPAPGAAAAEPVPGPTVVPAPDGAPVGTGGAPAEPVPATAARYDYWDVAEDAAPAGQAHAPGVPEIDEDAPPFATRPFATIPRLNRVRSTPIPPEDDDDE